MNERSELLNEKEIKVEEKEIIFFLIILSDEWYVMNSIVYHNELIS